MTDRTISRKGLLTAGAAALAGPRAAGAAGAEGAALAGILRTAPRGNSALLDTAGATIELRLVPNTKFRRAGGGSFLVGDEVAAEGRWQGDTFLVEQLLSLLRPLEGRLLGTRGEEIATSTGSARLSETTRVRIGTDWYGPEALAQLRGREVAVHSVLDPANGIAVADSVVLDE